ncbi:methyltransferase domain-containing protein [Kitasatospora sp. NPDC058397]|uniref:methyltransferase domain-containing protein n=1 Tax=unclassified Kitasatospora TaxID=2633591 RepID=UPI0036469CA4
MHADHAKPDDRPTGLPTSSATLTPLVVKMLRHGRIAAEHDLLDIGTGAGGLTAIAATRLGSDRVTSVDIDGYLVDAARDRLAGMGLSPHFVTQDATDALPGDYDRIVATVSARPVPVPWLQALRRGGRLVTTIADTALILTAWKTPDGKTAREADGENVKLFRYPVTDIRNNWEVWSMLTISIPGIEVDFEETPEGRTACLAHPDGSWARAEATKFEPPTVHQSGPRRLWSELESIRNWREVEGGLPFYGCRAVVTPDGVIHLSRGRWSATIG